MRCRGDGYAIRRRRHCIGLYRGILGCTMKPWSASCSLLLLIGYRTTALNIDRDRRRRRLGCFAEMYASVLDCLTNQLPSVAVVWCALARRAGFTAVLWAVGCLGASDRRTAVLPELVHLITLATGRGSEGPFRVAAWGGHLGPSRPRPTRRDGPG